MKNPVRVIVITVAIVAVLAIGALIFGLMASRPAPAPSGTAATASGESAQVVREESHVLDDAGEGAVTVVEFLDFECEACGAFYPIVEDIRERYDGQITYIVRYFPLAGHSNSVNAAIAAEAAAQQDSFEEMYHRLLSTQAEWGESDESKAPLFRTYAEDLGLDMDAYDAAVADRATVDRVERDISEGQALGVERTPTFFINGQPLDLQRLDDLENGIIAALSSAE